MNQRLTDIRRAQLDQLLSGGTNMAGGGLLKSVAKAAKPAAKAVTKVVEAAPQAEALRLAQQRAKSVGQSKDPRTRMLQQGYDDSWYHGTTGDIFRFRPDLLGETTGAQSAKKGFFFARDPLNPPESMLKKSNDPAAEDLLRKMGIPEEDIAKLNTVSMEGHGPDTASGYALIGGSREYKEAMRKAKAAERRGDWPEYEKQMQIAENSETTRMQYGQNVIAKYGDARDKMLEDIKNVWYGSQNSERFKNMSQADYEAYDKKFKELMPYGWYNSYSNSQLEGLKKELFDTVGEKNAEKVLNKINKFQSARNERALIEKTQEGGNVMPVALRYENPMVYDFEGKPYRDQSYSDLVDQALTAGNDALILKNTYDPGGGPSRLIDVGVVFEPDQIRSRFAAFDPLRKTAATAAAAGLAAPDLLAKEQDKAQGGLVHLAGGGDPRKRGLFPKMSTQAIVDSPGFDPEVPSDLSRAYARRMAEKDAYGRSMADQKLTPAQRAVAGAEATGMIGSALFEGVQQLPKLLDGEEAYTKAVGEGMYQPRFQPEKAAEYAGNVGDFLEKLETEYKMPALTPELMPFIGAAEAAKQQSKRAVKQGALTAASRMDAGPKAGSMAAQRGAVKLGGGNWVDSELKRGLKRQTYPESYIESRKKDLIENNLNLTPDAVAQGELLKRNIASMEQANAFNRWVETKVGSYVRNQMSTPDDPVVKMLDVRSAKIEADYQAGQKRLAKLDERIAQAPSSTQGERNTLANLQRTRAQRAADIENDRELAINSLLPEGRDYSGYDYLENNADHLIDIRKKTGFPIEGYGQFKPAKAWEAAQDLIIGIKPAENYQGSAEKLAAVKDAEKAYKQYMEVELPQKFKEFINNTNLPKSEKQTLIKKTPVHHMKEIIGGDEKYDQITDDVRKARNKANAGNIAYEKDNPYLAKLPPDTTVYDAAYMPDLGIDHIIDVLRDDIASGKLKLEDLNKITMDQAVKRAGEYDFEMAKKARDSVAQSRATMPVYKEYPEGYKWVQLTKPGEFNAESNAMGHSVRGYEPEKGDPDWTPESGDSGNPYYGHGGWEAIKSGNAKVYSLVDPSGNPHTTIEVKANPNPYPVSGEAFAMLPSKTKAEYGQYVREWRQRNPDIEELTDEHTTQALKEAGVPPQPDIITQIKGKGNARPSEKYDQYTQDFVRSGKWSDVDDLKNTGLYPISKDYLGHTSTWTPEAEDVKHLTKQQRMEALAKAIDAGDLPEKGYATRSEIDESLRKHGRPTYAEDTDELLRQLQPPPEQGMAGGGSVGLKNALNNLLRTDKPEVHMGVGGAAAKAALKAAEAAKVAKAAYSPKVLNSTIDKFVAKIAAENPKLSEEDVLKKATRQATSKLEWERVQKPELEKTYGPLVKTPYSKTNVNKMQNTAEVVTERKRKANEFLDQPTEPWTPPAPELQAFDRSSIKDALEGFPGVDQTAFPRDIPTRASTSHVDELYADPENRALIEKQIKRGLPLGGETFYASLYPVKQAVLEAGMPAEKFDRWIHSLAPASARNSIMNEMASGQFLRDMNARGIPLTEENVAREMAVYKEKFGIGLPLMPLHREGVAKVIEGGQDLREMSKANIPTNYKIPTYGSQKAGDFANSVVLDVHEAGGQTQGSRFHPYFNEQGGFGNTEYNAGEQGLLGIAGDLGIPGGMAQAGRWFGGGELTGLRSPRGDALDLLEKQVAYTLSKKGIQPNPANVRAEVLRQIETGEGDLLPWYRKEGMPDLRQTGLQRKEGGEVTMEGGLTHCKTKKVKRHGNTVPH